MDTTLVTPEKVGFPVIRFALGLRPLSHRQCIQRIEEPFCRRGLERSRLRSQLSPVPMKDRPDNAIIRSSFGSAVKSRIESTKMASGKRLGKETKDVRVPVTSFQTMKSFAVTSSITAPKSSISINSWATCSNSLKSSASWAIRSWWLLATTECLSLAAKQRCMIGESACRWQFVGK